MTKIDPHSYFDDQQPRTKSWYLRLKVDFEAKTLNGTATLFLSEHSGGPLDLDTRGLKIHQVYGQRPDESLKYELFKEEGFLGQRLRVELPAGESSITIAYETSPEASGLQWLEPSQTEGKQHPFLFSQCQAIHARSLVPCQDCPVARIPYEAEITVPEGYTAVMSAGPAGDVPAENSWRTFRFSMPQPIPPYLLALAVGQLESRDLSPRARIWAESATIEKAAWEFAEVESFIQKAEGLFGPYDWDRYDMLVLPPSFPYGGMENPRMNFLTPTLLAGDRSLVETLVHELAHSWTGNLVTNATAEHFWINEGFTVWAERRLLRIIYGEETELFGWAIGQKSLDASLERFKDQPHLSLLRTHLEGIDPDDAYSTIPYEKGARFVRRMEEAMGTETFERFLREYMDHFRFMAITTEQFCAFIEEKHPGILARINAEAWLHQSGIPADAPAFRSAKIEELTALAQSFGKGIKPEPATLAAWGSKEILTYMQNLPREISHSDCVWLDEHLHLTARGNYEILVEWLAIALGSDYEPVFARAREVLTTVGRMKYLRPLYAALGKHKRTQALGRSIFEVASPGYHGLSRRAAQDTMSKWAEIKECALSVG